MAVADIIIKYTKPINGIKKVSGNDYEFTIDNTDRDMLDSGTIVVKMNGKKKHLLGLEYPFNNSVKARIYNLDKDRYASPQEISLLRTELLPLLGADTSANKKKP